MKFLMIPFIIIMAIVKFIWSGLKLILVILLICALLVFLAPFIGLGTIIGLS